MAEKYQLLGRLRPEEYLALEADIRERGVQVPVEVDEEGNVLDGHHRVEIAQRLGKPYETLVRRFATEREKREHVLKLNLARRHMDSVQWGQAFGRLLDLRGVRTGRGARNDALTSATVAEVAAELGVPERTARHRLSQASAFDALSPAERESIISGEKTLQQLRRGHKEQIRQARREENQELVQAAPTLEAALGSAKFATIVIDPPWDPGDEGEGKGEGLYGRGHPPYATMPFAEIRDLPVGAYADDDCHLYCWVTNRSLPKAFALLETWGFRYCTAVTWCKPHFGMGAYFRGATEHVLFGVRGSQPLKRRDAGTWFEAPRGPGGHSSKPVEFYELVESCSPGPYLEIFARGQREGWVSWGAEA